MQSLRVPIATSIAALAMTAMLTVALPPAEAVVPGFPGEIVYVNEDAGTIEVASLTGTPSYVIAPATIDPESYVYPNPVWSPDGSRIAFVGGSVESPDIFVVNSDGSALTNITNSPDAEMDPTWSPDGQRIAYTRHEGPMGYYLNQGEVWTMDATGANRQRLVSGPISDIGDEGEHLIGHASNPDWSPDGTTIAIQYGPGNDSQDIVLLHLNDGAPPSMSRLTSSDFEAYADNPSWSADGQYIAYRGGVAEPRCCRENLLLHVVDRQGNDRELPYSPGSYFPGEAEASVTWSPAGHDLLFSSGGDLLIAPLDGGDVQTLPFGGGAPNWQASSVQRLFGFERIATAVDIAEANFGSGQAESAVLATAYNYPDALAGAALAAAKNGPVLLTGRESLDSQTAAALQRMLPPGGPVYLLGGSVALSDEVQASIQSLGYDAIRLAGRNRYETAVAVINAIGPITQVLLATGNDYEAALLGGAAAGHLEAGLLLTNGTITDAAADAYIASHADLARTAVGTDAVHADPQAIPLPAADPYQLSVDVATAFYAGATTFAVASGRDYPDALAGGVDAARRGAPLLLTEAETLPQPVRTYLQQYGDAWTGGVVYGGSVAVGREVFRTLQAIAYKPGLS